MTSMELRIPSSISAVPLVATCFFRASPSGRDRECLARIGYADLRGSGSVDIYYPFADIGILWFREERDVGCVSEMLKQKNFPTPDAAHELLYWLSETLGMDAQGICVELIEARRCLVAHGEESDFFEGDGERGARFSTRWAADVGFAGERDPPVDFLGLIKGVDRVSFVPRRRRDHIEI